MTSSRGLASSQNFPLRHRQHSPRMLRFSAPTIPKTRDERDGLVSAHVRHQHAHQQQPAHVRPAARQIRTCVPRPNLPWYNSIWRVDAAQPRRKVGPTVLSPRFLLRAPGPCRPHERHRASVSDGVEDVGHYSVESASSVATRQFPQICAGDVRSELMSRTALDE